MPAENIRVLVVDDSAVIRQILCDLIGQAPGMEVAGTAADGREALEQIDRLHPDVVTLDLQMPNMDGLETLDALFAREAVAVIVVSSLTQFGATVTLDALERGALDYAPKPQGTADLRAALNEELLWKIRTAAKVDMRRILSARRERKVRREEATTRRRMVEEIPGVSLGQLADKCIALGISTGGPPALTVLLSELQPPMPPIVVVQHMPAGFTKALAVRLDMISRLSIKEAETGDVLRPNHVLIAPGNRHVRLRQNDKMVKAVLEDGPPVSGHRPSVDVMMRSAAQVFGPRCLGVVMTGMGRDGVDGCRAIRAAGGYVLGQDEASSDVYGMNKAAYEAGNVDRQFSLDAAVGVISLQVKQLWQYAPKAAPPLSG